MPKRAWVVPFQVRSQGLDVGFPHAWLAGAQLLGPSTSQYDITKKWEYRHYHMWYGIPSGTLTMELNTFVLKIID